MSGYAKSLQNTDRSRGRLNDGGEKCTGKHTENGILEKDKKPGKAGNIAQSRNGGGRSVHTEHQNGKADQDHADILLFAVFDEHIKDDADQGENRGERGRL